MSVLSFLQQAAANVLDGVAQQGERAARVASQRGASSGQIDEVAYRASEARDKARELREQAKEEKKRAAAERANIENELDDACSRAVAASQLADKQVLDALEEMLRRRSAEANSVEITNQDEKEIIVSEEKSEIIAETLQKILVLISEYASEQVGVEDIRNATEDEIDDASSNFLDNSDDLRADILSRQRVLNAISEIVSKIDDAFPEETLTMGFTSLSVSCTAASANGLLTKAIIDDFWAKNE